MRDGPECTGHPLGGQLCPNKHPCYDGAGMPAVTVVGMVQSCGLGNHIAASSRSAVTFSDIFSYCHHVVANADLFMSFYHMFLFLHVLYISMLLFQFTC